MLKIKVSVGPEQWDPIKEEFIEAQTVELELEHSLVSISKWESKWCKSFLSSKEKSFEETVDYIKMMVTTENVDPDIFNHLTQVNVDQITDYIGAPMTATVFGGDQNKSGSREVITSELIYYWMIAQNIPFECQNWHLNRLLTLIRVCNIKNAPPKKRSQGEIMRSNTALNKARREQMNTKG